MRLPSIAFLYFCKMYWAHISSVREARNLGSLYQEKFQQQKQPNIISDKVNLISPWQKFIDIESWAHLGCVQIRLKIRREDDWIITYYDRNSTEHMKNIYDQDLRVTWRFAQWCIKNNRNKLFGNSGKKEKPKEIRILNVGMTHWTVHSRDYDSKLNFGSNKARQDHIYIYLWSNTNTYLWGQTFKFLFLFFFCFFLFCFPFSICLLFDL